MNKSFVAAVAAGFLALPAAAGRHVDLGDPHALDAIQAENPAQYEKVMGILRLASDVSCETLPQMLKVQYGAEHVHCAGALILTSYPAKRRLSFQLDDTAFSGNVRLTGKPATLRRVNPQTSNHVTPVTLP